MTQWVGQSTLLTFNSAPWGFCVTNSLWSNTGSHSVLGRSVSRERPHVGTDWESVLTTAACYSPPASGSLDDAQGRCQEPWGLSSLTSTFFFYFLPVCESLRQHWLLLDWGVTCGRALDQHVSEANFIFVAWSRFSGLVLVRVFFLNQHCCRLLCWRRRGSLLLAVSSSTRLFVNIHSCINYPSAGVGVALIIPPRDNVSSSSVLSRWYFYSREKGNPGQTGSYSDLKIKEGWRKKPAALFVMVY